MEAIKTPNNMSDKVRNWVIQFNVEYYKKHKKYPDSWIIAESYAEHHLEDVLGEVEQLIFKESEAYKERTASKLELQRIGFKHGAYWLLNLLKQMK